MKSCLRHGAIVGSVPATSSSFDRKYDALSTSMGPSVWSGSSYLRASGTFDASM
jgi:hypothetical protein